MSVSRATAERTQAEREVCAAGAATRYRPADAVLPPEEAPDVESWLPVYCLFGTLLVFFALGGFWIWHFAR
jgi:hypothetical protein